MYTVKVDNDWLYHPLLDNYQAVSLKLTQGANSFDAFDFTVYPGNDAYGRLYKRKSIYKIYKDDVLLSRGRIVDTTRGFLNNLDVVCNGQGDFLNDSHVPIYNFGGTVIEYVQLLIDSHNQQMHGDSEKLFSLRSVTVADPNNYIVRASGDRSATTWSELQEKCIKLLGGYLVFDYSESDGVCYIDYLSDSLQESNQSVEYGKNLLDFSEQILADATYSAVYGYGAKIGQDTTAADGTTISAPRLTIAAINGGNDYIYDQAAVDAIGWNYDYQTWDDVNTPDILLERMKTALTNDVSFQRNLVLTAADLSAIDRTVEDFKPLDYIMGISRPHGLSERFMIDKVELDLQNPTSNKLSIGKQAKTLSDITNGQSLVTGPKGSDGAAGYTAYLSNQTVVLAANAMGGIMSYDQSPTNVFVVKGDGTYMTPQPDGTALRNDEFSVTTDSVGITPAVGMVMVNNHVVLFGKASGMAPKLDNNATITFHVKIHANFQETTVDLVQSITSIAQGITGDAGIDSWTFRRYSPYANGGAADGSQMTSLPNADSSFVGSQTTVSVFASSNPADYVWTTYKPSLTKSISPPSPATIGAIWQYTGSTAITVGSVWIQPQTTYVWNGSNWDLDVLRSTNLQVDDGFITDLMVQNLNGQKIWANSISAYQLTADAIQVGLSQWGNTVRIDPSQIRWLNNGVTVASLDWAGYHYYVNNQLVGDMGAYNYAGTNAQGIGFNLHSATGGKFMTWAVDNNVKMIWTTDPVVGNTSTGLIVNDNFNVVNGGGWFANGLAVKSPQIGMISLVDVVNILRAKGII